ncbi:lipoyl protein ligase domain-containing protein [Colwellia sp. RSH04]|uniref:lipoate--protein ligase family protein n=1 Tax=Colwellia sp. RSH04 TaxID=2305464 RepID=UPI000E58CAA9|nr:lipoate--protein ligase [Colwellia sp. RSH04]RHW76339.1 lipoate--protein ligase [Colwellia sp. RSH04]
MNKQKHKLLQFETSSVEHVFSKESTLLKQLQQGELDQCLMLWQANEPTLVLPAGKKWPESLELINTLKESGWQLYARKTGGAPVPQCQGVINLSHLYQWHQDKPYSITQAYENLCAVLKRFFAQWGIEVQAHATEHSYCDGDYNLNINGKKVVGTAQRVVLKSGGGKIVLAQAFILIDVLFEQLIQPVNLCYQQGGKTERVKAEVHTSLFEHTSERPTINALYQSLIKAFVDSELYQ